MELCPHGLAETAQTHQQRLVQALVYCTPHGLSWNTMMASESYGRLAHGHSARLCVEQLAELLLAAECQLDQYRLTPGSSRCMVEPSMQGTTASPHTCTNQAEQLP